MTQLYFPTTIALLALNACGSSGRPVGLPPPEYQSPHVEPWTPPAGAPAAGPPAPTAETPPQAAPEPQAAPAPENLGGSGATLPAGTP
jgi:hypothetical protein